MTTMRFKLQSRTETATNPGLVHLQFVALQQDIFGEGVPNVQFAMAVTKATADSFEIGAEYNADLALAPAA